MADTSINTTVAQTHIKRIVGPTILMGDGMYFDYEAPDATHLTIDDYAWGLATNIRFRGQSRHGPDRNRCAYNVAQHAVYLANAMLDDGCSYTQAYQGLMHESDEVPWPDIPGPAKTLLPPEVKELIKRSADAIDRAFCVSNEHKDLVKYYDIRMLATEKRDLMPHSGSDQWSFVRGYEPFKFTIEPWSIEKAAREFVLLYEFLRPRATLERSEAAHA